MAAYASFTCLSGRLRTVLPVAAKMALSGRRRSRGDWRGRGWRQAAAWTSSAANASGGEAH
jgi:hypothetical protein